MYIVTHGLTCFYLVSFFCTFALARKTPKRFILFFFPLFFLVPLKQKMTGNNIMCGRRRNADRHCVTLVQLGSNYFFSSIRKSHEPIMPDNVCLSYSNCTMGKVYSH